MRASRKSVTRIVLGCVGALLFAGVAAPFIRADMYGRQIREAMERGLNRKVEIGKVRFNLFTGPGFTIEDVVIYDDPSAGIEPFAHMLELDAQVRLSSLIAGRIEFSRLRFVEPSVNIVKPAVGPWNLVPLLQHTVAAKTGAASARLPEIQVSGGRINFKFADRKSPFYLTNADVIVAPRTSEKGAYLIRFSGEPSRTDRAAQGFGVFKAAGRLLTGAGDSRLEVDVELERGELADLVTLFRGQSVGLHGQVATTAKVYGGLSNLQILGTVSLEDIHRWDVAPERTGGIALKYRGSYNAVSQRMEIAAGPKDNPGVPVSARLIVDKALSQPHWSADLSVNGVPASALVEVARDMGAPIPQEVAVRGNVVGVVGYGPAAGLQGQLAVDAATVTLGNGPELTIGKAGVLIAGEELRLTPASVSGEGRSAELEATFIPTQHLFDATIRGKAMPVSSLASGTLIATSANPFVSRLSGGTWSGWIRYVSDAEQEGTWTANLDIRDTTTRIPGVAVPVRIAAAALELDGTDVQMRRMRLTAGELHIDGEYSYATEGNLHAFTANMPTASAQELERVLLPALRQNAGLLARMRFARSSVPEWLRQRRARGRINVGTLTLGEVAIQDFETRVDWSGASVRFTGVHGDVEDGVLRGDAFVDLSPSGPNYKINGNLTNVAWRGGKVDVSGTFTTNGTGEELLANLRSEGTFQARAVDIVTEVPFRTLSGAYSLAVARLGPQVRLTSLQASTAAERFLGQGATQPDGRLQLELVSANRVMHLSGPVAPLRLEVTTERAAGHTR